mgnify:CR=1 FL=1
MAKNYYEIYKESFNNDIKLDEFDITKLIINSKLNNEEIKTLYLNKNHSFYNIILNRCWSSIACSPEHVYSNGEKKPYYSLKHFGYNSPERRRDFIYLETFKTGDILIYKNKNDETYSVDKNKKLVPNIVTYEDGEYAYIYIEGKGFVGVNLGDDGKENTKDDRNEFNAKYYKDNNLTLYQNYKNPSDELLEIANMQTLLGKDYYVILRPSLYYSLEIKHSNTAILIISIIISILILLCGAFFIWKCIKLKKKGKEFNFANFKKELLLFDDK